jgi:isoamylase
MTGSADLFAPRWDAGLPGGLAAGRPPAAGLNSASFLAQGPLAARVDALLPAEAGAGERAALGRTLLLAALLAQGAPAFAQDAVAEPAAARFVRVLLRLRARYAPLLAPAAGAPRELRWHGARPGALAPASSSQRVPAPGTRSLMVLPGAAAALDTCLALRLRARRCCAPARDGLRMTPLALHLASWASLVQCR